MNRRDNNGKESAESSIEKLKNVKLPKEKKPGKRLKTFWSILILLAAYWASGAGLIFFMRNNWQPDVNMAGALVALLMGFLAFGCYIMIRHKDLVSSLKQVLFVSVLLVVANILTLVTMSINVGFIPSLLTVLLIALMANEKAAMLSAIPMAVNAGVAASVLDGTRNGPIAIVFALIISSLTAVYALNMRKTRSSTVIASGVAGITGVITYAAVMLAGGEVFTGYWQNLLWLIGSCLMCGILTVGLMPVFEALFDIASEARLNELLNNNNPLLKRLMTEAPGTYHHSLLVASLGEAAAQAIDANALLVRVAAYYHDVGKLRSPVCFKENQRGYNIHDDLDPYESAKRIIAHQQDGVTLLEKAKFPSDVIKIVGMHHGDSVMVYFYDKAKKAAPEGTEIDESKFRYPSKKPNTKEAAILMLADCCEAAVRSMPNPTMDEVKAKVREVMTHKWDKRDSMLWDSPLTFTEIKQIEASFFNTFAALHHERVEYPDLEEIDVR